LLKHAIMRQEEIRDFHSAADEHECFWQVTQCRLVNREDSEAPDACLTLKMETSCSFQTSVAIYRATRHTIPEDMNQDRQDVPLSDYPTTVKSTTVYYVYIYIHMQSKTQFVRWYHYVICNTNVK